MEQTNGFVRVIPDIKYDISNLISSEEGLNDSQDSFDIDESKNTNSYLFLEYRYNRKLQKKIKIHPVF